MELHIIQRRILERLIGGANRFSDIRPDDTESNLFQYHLGKLLAAKLVMKTDNGYYLTPRGLHVASLWSGDLQNIRLQPALVTMVLLSDKNGRIAVFVRDKEPYLGRFAPPFGKVHYGEDLATAASRELVEKLGISSSAALEQTGAVTINQDNAHMVAVLFRGQLPDGYSGQVMSLSELATSPDAMPGLHVLTT